MASKMAGNRKEIGEVEVIKNSYEGLSQGRQCFGKNNDALQHYKMFISYRDSLINEENTLKPFGCRCNMGTMKRCHGPVLFGRIEVAGQEAQKQNLLPTVLLPDLH